MRWALLGLLLSGCVVTTTTRPGPAPAPPDDGGTCASAFETLERLGGCEQDLDGWVKRCDDADDADEDVGLRLPLQCWTEARSCEEYSACQIRD